MRSFGFFGESAWLSFLLFQTLYINCHILLYCLTFYIYFIISRHNEDIINLDYEIAVLKKKVEELEKERHND